MTRKLKMHGSIPGYIPGPILSRGNKVFLLSLIGVPSLLYVLLDRRWNQNLEDEKALEIEGRARWLEQAEQRRTPISGKA